MAFSAKPTNSCLASLPSLFASPNPSNPHPSLSFPFKPIKLQISSSIPLSLNRKESILRVSVIAAQQEGETPILLEEQGGGEISWAEAPESAGGEADGFVEPPEEAKLYVGNVPYDVDGGSLAQVFEAAGTVEYVDIICNRETGGSRGFGFVTMSTVEEAEKAVEMLNRYDLNGRLLTVSKAAKKGSKPPARVFTPRYRIYVGNLPWSVDDERLKQVFSEYGQVVSARVLTDRETGRSRGFGFVVMSTEAELNEAVAKLDGAELEGRLIRVNIAADTPPRTSS